MTAVEGDQARLAVKARNARGYQWQRMMSGAWQDMVGQQADALLLPSVSLGDSGAQFRVQVRGGVETLASAVATLTVTRKAQAAAITVQPASQVLFDGEALSWAVTASGTDLSYQWQRSRDGMSWTDVPGATAASWSVGKVSLLDNGMGVRVVVSNALGRVISAVATLEVFAPPSAPTFLSQPLDVSVTGGRAASFEAQVLGQPTPVLQWQRSSDGVQWIDVPQAQAPRLLLPTVSASDDGSRFRLSASNRVAHVFSQAVRLTVLPAPQAPSWRTEPQSVQVSIGQDAIFTAQLVAGATAVLQWQMSRDGGKSWQTLAGESAAQLVIASASSREAGNWYRMVASNEAGVITSRAAQLQLDARLGMRLLLGDGGRRGARDGALMEAQFDAPVVLTQDPQGNLYLYDEGLVRKIDFAAGRVVTLAGALGQHGSADGPSATARFEGLNSRGTAVDSKGQVFVADGSRIRTISPSGVVSTLVRNVPPYVEYGQFWNTLVVHPITDELFAQVDCHIYRVATDGSVDRVSGEAYCGDQKDGERGKAVWRRIWDFGIDASGRLIAEEIAGLIREVMPTGRVVTLGRSVDMPKALEFKKPRRARDNAYFGASWGTLSAFVYAYPATAYGSSLSTGPWDHETGGLVPGIELVAGRLSMASLPPGSKALGDHQPIRWISSLPGGNAWVKLASEDPVLWQLDRAGQVTAWPLPRRELGKHEFEPMVMLPDRLLACRSETIYSNELISITKGGGVQVLGTFSVNADLGRCRGLLWDAPRGRVFDIADSPDGGAYDFQTKKVSTLRELGFAWDRNMKNLAAFPDGALLVVGSDRRSLKRLNSDGTTQKLGEVEDGDFIGPAAIDQAGVVYFLQWARQEIYRLKTSPVGEVELVSGTAGVRSTEPGANPSWRDAFDLKIWGPDQLLVTTPGAVTVLDVPAGVDCGCTPTAKAVQARKAALSR